MVGARLVCSAGARSFGAGWEGASAGRGGGGNGGDAAVDALEACSEKASSAVIMKKARMRMRACGSLRLRQVEGSFGAIDESHRAAKVVKDIRRPPAPTRICLRRYRFEGILIGRFMT